MTASDDDLIQKGQDDLIRRGDALDAMNSVALTYGATWEPHSVKLCKDAIAAIPAAQVGVKPCGGCGEINPQKRCIGCSHDFGTPESAWVRKYRNVALQPSPDVTALVEALEKLVHAVCGETGFAQSVRDCSGFAYPWPALDEAELIARAALARVKGGKA